MRKATGFEFSSYALKDQRSIHLEYTVTFDDATTQLFIESIKLPQTVSDVPSELLHRVLQTLHLMCGLSYYKLYCPSQITVKSIRLTKQQADFWNTVYTKGLGEFFYKNNIDFRGLIDFPFEQAFKKIQPVRCKNAEQAVMGVGGGKDSIVTYELLRNTFKVTPVVLETQKEYRLIQHVLAVMQATPIQIQRTLDPKLFERNSSPGSYNGHIPMTAIYSSILLLSAVLYGYKYIVMSNERSANYGNVDYLGVQINHQWSKSHEFEKLFRTYIHTFITPDIEYFSLLRSLNELSIVKKFVQYPAYFQTFSSCNTNFQIHAKTGSDSRWCGHCPKCAFVFVLLAAFLSKQQLLSIFGKNILADEALIPLYQELLGIRAFKPFECVGTPEEVTAAFYLAYKNGEFSEDAVMKMFEREILPQIVNPDTLVADNLSKAGEQFVPDVFKELI